MAYLESYQLTLDPEFRGRVSMCIAEQAKVFTNDGRDEYKLLADLAIGDLQIVTNQMMPLVATQPGMTGASTDGDIVSAVQALWPVAGDRLVPAPLPEPPAPIG